MAAPAAHDSVADSLLLALLERGDAALASAAALHRCLAAARLELAFSRTQRGSMTGASVAYVPKGALRAAARVRVVAAGGDGGGGDGDGDGNGGSGSDGGGRSGARLRLALAVASRSAVTAAALADAGAVAAPGIECGAAGVGSAAPPGGDGVRQRRGIGGGSGAGSGGGGGGGAGIGGGGSAGDSARMGGLPPGSDGGGEPLRWFGANASPSVAKGRAAFSEALGLAITAANARAAVQELSGAPTLLEAAE
jgi:hypothetical protein